MENLTGQTLGQYELRELLGRGGMGAVYRGYQRSLRRDVAVKVLYTTLATQTGYGERFVREAQTAAALEHAHIVPIYDYGTEQGLSYVVMRLLTGGSLAERIEHSNETGRPLPSLMEVVTITTNLASALDYAHSQGVIHRDIKDNNVMFDNQGRVFLVDFGIAKLMSVSGTSGLTGTGALVGTPWYMAPEQWRGDPVTPAVDQYALAVTVYVMLTGKMPFEAETPYQLMHKHLHEQPTPVESWREDLPSDIGRVLMRALGKEPAERYPNVSAFAQDMAFAASDLPGATQSTGFFTTPLPARIALTSQPDSEERTALEAPASQTSPPPAPMQVSQPVAAPAPSSSPPVPLWAIAAVVMALLAGVIVGVVVILPMRAPQPTGIPIAGGEPTATHTPLPPGAVPTEPEAEANSAPTEAELDTESEPPVAAQPPTQPPADVPSDTPAPAQTEAPTATDVPTDTPQPPSDTPVPTSTPVIVAQAVEPTVTDMPTETSSPTQEPTLALTDIPTQIPTETAAATVTLTHTPEPTDTPIPPTSTRRPSDTPTATETATSTPTETASPSATLTRTPQPTDTPIPPTATRLPSETPLPSETFTSTPTEPPTLTFTPTDMPADTPAPASTPTACQVADLNQNGIVDIFDIRLLARAYGSAAGDDLYDARLDFDSSGTINILDLRRVTSQFGETC
jgi:serine/threonine protein kinase